MTTPAAQDASPAAQECRADRERSRLAKASAEVIAEGSKSFATAARLFEPETRKSALMLYAWCRSCDDAIDDQILGFRQVPTEDRPDLEGRVKALEDKTRQAIAGTYLDDLPFDAVGVVARRHALPLVLLRTHLDGFAADARGKRYREMDDLFGYCYQVAGVVGVMMAQVMGVGGNQGTSRSVSDTLDRACDLGLAFQLTNIARDIVEDTQAGRVYLPLSWLAADGIDPGDLGERRHAQKVDDYARRLIAEAEPYYASSLAGLKALPLRSAWAIASAHGIYRQIGQVRLFQSSSEESRAVTSRWQKFRQLGLGAGRALASRSSSSPPRPAELWTRPRLTGIDV